MQSTLVEGNGGFDIITGALRMDGVPVFNNLRGGDGADLLIGYGQSLLEGGPGDDDLEHRGNGGASLVGGTGDDNYTYYRTGSGIAEITETPGGDDFVSFEADGAGTVFVTPAGAVRGTRRVVFNNAAEIETLEVRGDPGFGSNGDDYDINPSPFTTIRINEFGIDNGVDTLIYRADEGLCVTTGSGIIRMDGFQPVVYSSVEDVTIEGFNDCNENGAGDGCDIDPTDPDGDGMVSADCNNNSMPDECESVGDCNDNGVIDSCDPNADTDSVIDDCDNCVNVANEDQLDTDGDGVGDACDNCRSYCNPNQADANNNGVGDVCEIRMGDEILPPPGGVVPECDSISPWVSCDCIDYSGADFSATEANRRDQSCIGGSDAGCACFDDVDCAANNCDLDSLSSVTPPSSVFYYQNVYGNEGRFFANEVGPDTIGVTWKDTLGNDIGAAVEYELTGDPPVSMAGGGLEYTRSVPELFRNVLLDTSFGNRSVVLDGPFTPRVQYNSVFRECPIGSAVSDFRLSVTPDGNLVELPNGDDTPTGRIVIQYTDGPGGPLTGLEIVNVRDASPSDSLVPVGRQIPIPDSDLCKAACLQDECLRDVPLGGEVAFQRVEAPLEIWPIQPVAPASDLQVLWFKESAVGNCWPSDWTRHTSDWPQDAQNYVLDSVSPPDPDLVILPISEDPGDYCDAEVMYESDLALAEIVDGRFAMRNPGHAVVRFDKRVDVPGVTCDSLSTNFDRRDSVYFEVVRGYEHLDDAVFSGVSDWRIARQVIDNEHDSDTPQWPFGYIHAGQPYAANIYEDTGQIIPVNSVFESGSLEAWWFEEGSFAPNVYWPHKSAEYDPRWPTEDDPGDPNDDPIFIASRVGAGVYPDDPETTIYSAGAYQACDAGEMLGLPCADASQCPDGECVTAGGRETVPGWNPNDEHAIILPIGGGGRAFAVRDDDPWDLQSSGGPRVLVQYRQSASNLWAMGVHEVIATDLTTDFDYVNFPSQADPEQLVPVRAGLPLDPLFPVNFGGVAACESGDPSMPSTTITSVCVGGGNDGSLCESPSDCGGGICTADGVWVDRSGTIWAAEAEDDETGEPSAAAILLWENWVGDLGCQPWRDLGTGEPTPIVYRPSWPLAPPACSWPSDPTCARPVGIGQTVVDQSNQCGSVTVLHNGANVRIIDTSHEVSVEFPEFPQLGIALNQLPPHLFSGLIGGALEWPDRIHHTGSELFFRGIMSDRDREELYDVSSDTTYRARIDDLYALSRDQLANPLPNPNMKFISAAAADTKPGWVVLAFQNDTACAPVGEPTVQVWQIDCPPDSGEIRVLVPTCPFNEKQVLQITVDGGGAPENLVYQWQWAVDQEGPWHDYAAPSGYEDGQGLREVIVKGSSPFTLADSWWRVRYRGYANCPCIGGDCGEGIDPWPAHLAGGDSVISDWTEPQLAEGWIKRVLRGLNPFDVRVRDFHASRTNTIVSMIRQAGSRFEAPVALNCTPENINDLGLIEAYETVLGRGRLFSIDQGISYDPANLALSLMTSQIVDLYMLLGNEAFADASDPTIGFFGNQAPEDPSAAFSFEGQAPSLLEEELALLRGVSNSASPLEDADGFIIATPYNRLLWNFIPGNNPGRVAYANNYQLVGKPSAINAYPQGHGDAWGHYLTAIKKFYTLLRHPVYEWIVSTEFVLIGGQEPLEVSYQYERKFARVAAAKAKTGAAITALTFRQLYDAEPVNREGYPDPSSEFPDRRWGVADWARRTGQGAYFDWLVINALVDDIDDDPDHQNTIRKVDRSTIREIGEIVEAYSEIENTLNNADAGLNPLGLSTAVVPFGLNPGQIDANQTHFDQIYERAVKALRNAETVFSWANENTQRLRGVQDDELEITNLNDQRETDFRNRLIEIFGRPYPEDVGPGGTYSQSECPGGQCPDIYHFDYVDTSVLAGISSDESEVTTFTVNMEEQEVEPINGTIVTTQRIVAFNVATNGFGLIKPETWTERPEPGAIQQARSELLQAIGRYRTARDDYGGMLANIQTDLDGLADLFDLNSDILVARGTTLAAEQTMRALLVTLNTTALMFQTVAEAADAVAEAASEAVPEVTIAGLAAGGSFGSIAKGLIEATGAGNQIAALTAANVAEASAFGIDQAIITANNITDITITGWEQDFQARERVRDLEKKLRDESTKRLQLYTLAESIKQAIGQYQSAVGRGQRLINERAAYRQKTAVQVSQYRYQDMAFRIFRNEALQKYRAQFDLTARYTYLLAKAYDYETNLLFSDESSGRRFLTDIVKERVLGRANCTATTCSPLVGNGLAGRLRDMSDAFEVARVELGFNSPTQFDRTFSLRWELFRIPTTPEFDQEWRDTLSAMQVADLDAMQEYNLFAQPLQGAPSVNRAIVLEFPTFIQAGHNFFGRPSTGDETLPSDRFAIKVHEYGVRFVDYPGAPLNNQVNVYLIPVGADTMRVPQCPDAPVRQWQLIDQTLPVPLVLGDQDYLEPEWQPWDGIDGGAGALVSRRLIPSVAACPADAPACDSSFKLTGRSAWNSRWLLIIPESELAGDDNVDGLDVLINGADGKGGVRDIQLNLTSYGYSGCASLAPAQGGASFETSLTNGAGQ